MHVNCERWLIDVTPDICEKCKNDAVFRQELAERKIAELERRYKISQDATKKRKKCSFAGKTIFKKAKCCGGHKARPTEFIYCNLYKKEITRQACRFCERRL